MPEASRSIPASQRPDSTSGETGVWNEMTDARGQVRPHWQQIERTISQWSVEDRSSMAATARRMIEDLGTTFNVYSDAGGAGQPFELDPVPLLVPPADWERVSAGLAQRIRLLDAVLADLHGPQTLLEDGLVPPDLLHSNRSFQSFARGVLPPGGRFLTTTGCDLLRQANGSWMVLRDHTASPGGLGQAFENRKVVSSVMAEAFENLGVVPLAGFLEIEREVFQSLSIARGQGANVVFLTPGFRHPSYFEHAYKARLLGFPLVEPADLTVRERRMFLKTLAGLRRVDVVVCRTGYEGLDPLQHWGGSGDGVPGMIEAWRTGNVAIANAPGSEFASSPALMSFLPAICSKWFGEELKLPFVETWWLGQTGVRNRVMEHLHRFILLSASPEVDPLLPVQCSALSPAARKQWAAVIASRPHDFVVQADVRPSESPSIEARSLRQRPVVWRAFTLNAGSAPVVLPGGLARVGKSRRPPQLWPGHAGFTKDVWITDTVGRESVPETKSAPGSGGQLLASEVPSRIAEQLFWVGRYAERIELATRLLRVTLRCVSGESGRSRQDPLAACAALIAGTGLLPEALVVHPARALRTLHGLIHDAKASAGIPALTRLLMQNAAAARDRLSDDTWRFFNRLETIVHPATPAPSGADMARTLDNMVLHLAAFAGMQAENMTRGHGWRFLETGRRIERAIGVLGLLRTAAAHGDDGLPVLDPLLETCDSVMTYRRRHFSRPRLDAVIALVFADRGNPRSAAYQIEVIAAEVGRFPGREDFGLMPGIRNQAAALSAGLDQMQCPEAQDFEALAAALEQFSDALTQHFFSHSVRRVY